MKLKKGDTVVVITGKDKGKQGEIQRVLPGADKVIVTGVNTATKHAKARRANDKAGIIDRDMPIHVSNVMLVHKGKPCASATRSATARRSASPGRAGRRRSSDVRGGARRRPAPIERPRLKASTPTRSRPTCSSSSAWRT